MKRVLAGMRASGQLHLGNYLGGAKGMIALQDKDDTETFYMVANLHGITTPFTPDELNKNTREVILDYLAIGVGPEKSAIFVQSDLADLHVQLAFYLSSVVTVARMQHLPTFKDKVKQYPENVTMALLNYPVLMAADILLYKADLVPVGIDQEPHIEVAREIARKMNDQYGTEFPEPQRFTIEGGAYIPSLTGEGKMSKSIPGSYISLVSTYPEVQAGTARIPTDSGHGNELPSTGGVPALFDMVEVFEGKERRSVYEDQYLNSSVRYSDVKNELAEAIYKELEPIQRKRAELAEDTGYVDKILKEGAAKARTVAQKTVEEVKQKMGLK